MQVRLARVVRDARAFRREVDARVLDATHARERALDARYARGAMHSLDVQARLREPITAERAVIDPTVSFVTGFLDRLLERARGEAASLDGGAPGREVDGCGPDAFDL